MKTIFGKIRFAAFVMAAVVMVGMTSCKKDKEPTQKELIIGEWEVKSFTIDGVEVKGTIVTTSKVEFEAYTGNNGDFEWLIVFGDGSTELTSGDYEVDEEDREVELQNNDGETITFEFDVENDELELDGIIEGERYLIKAERDE